MSMNVNPIFPNPEFTGKGQIGGDKGKQGQDFKDVLQDAINDVNKLQNESDQKIASLLKGESQDLHATILAVQQADTSFKMMMQVRNKIVEAYKELSRGGI